MNSERRQLEYTADCVACEGLLEDRDAVPAEYQPSWFEIRLCRAHSLIAIEALNKARPVGR